MNKTYPLWLVLGLAVVVIAIVLSGGLIKAYVHIPSFAVVVLISFLLSLSNHGIKEIGRSFQVAFRSSRSIKTDIENALLFFNGLGRYFATSGLIGTMTGVIALLSNLDDLSLVGLNVALALLTLYYGFIFRVFVAAPFITGLKKQMLSFTQ